MASPTLAQPLTETRRPALTQTLASARPAGCITITIAGPIANKASSPAIQRRWVIVRLLPAAGELLWADRGLEYIEFGMDSR